MDPVSHYLVGAAIGALRPPGAPPAYYWAAVAGAVIPDIDFVVRFWAGREGYLDVHRGPTHGPLGWAAAAAAVAGALALLYPGTPLLALALWALAGIASHVLLDLTNAYGTRVLSPWSRRRYAWDWTFVVDLPVLGLGVFNLALAAAFPTRRAGLAALALAAMAAYILWRGHVHQRVLAAVQARFAPLGARRVSVLPSAFGVNRWRYVVETADAYYTGSATWRPLQAEAPRRHLRREDRIVAAARMAPAGQIMARFCRHPNADWREDGEYYVVRLYDMQYENGSYNPFVAVVTLDRQLNLVDDRLTQDPPTLGRAGALLREELGRREREPAAGGKD